MRAFISKSCPLLLCHSLAAATIQKLSFLQQPKKLNHPTPYSMTSTNLLLKPTHLWKFKHPIETSYTLHFTQFFFFFDELKLYRTKHNKTIYPVNTGTSSPKEKAQTPSKLQQNTQQTNNTKNYKLNKLSKFHLYTSLRFFTLLLAMTLAKILDLTSHLICATIASSVLGVWPCNKAFLWCQRW